KLRRRATSAKPCIWIRLRPCIVRNIRITHSHYTGLSTRTKSGIVLPTHHGFRAEAAMSQLLFITSSLFGDASLSRHVASEFVDAWRAAHPATAVVARDVAADPVPHLAQDTLVAAMTPPDQRSAEQNQAAALGDALIAEVEASDVIVLAAPMYN